MDTELKSFLNFFSLSASLIIISFLSVISLMDVIKNSGFPSSSLLKVVLTSVQIKCPSLCKYLFSNLKESASEFNSFLMTNSLSAISSGWVISCHFFSLNSCSVYPRILIKLSFTLREPSSPVIDFPRGEFSNICRNLFSL